MTAGDRRDAHLRTKLQRCESQLRLACLRLQALEALLPAAPEGLTPQQLKALRSILSDTSVVLGCAEGGAR